MGKSYEDRLDAADEMRGKAIPERFDPLLEAVCRQIHTYSEIETDESWKEVWEGMTDAYRTAMGGGHSILRHARDIIRIVKFHPLGGADE